MSKPKEPPAKPGATGVRRCRTGSKQYLRPIFIWLAIGTLACVPACKKSDGLKRVEVRGRVTYEKKPVARGLITFRPAHGSSGPIAGAGIIEGKYAISREKGPTVGAHEVEIKIVDADKESSRQRPPEAAIQHAINLKSYSQQIEIQEGANELEFALPFETPAGEVSTKR
jgi:hypothetical protein